MIITAHAISDAISLRIRAGIPSGPGAEFLARSKARPMSAKEGGGTPRKEYRRDHSSRKGAAKEGTGSFEGIPADSSGRVSPLLCRAIRFPERR